MSSIILNRPWAFRNPPESKVLQLAKELSLPKSIVSFLLNRGLDTKERISSHLNCSIKGLTNPLDTNMKGLKEASKLVAEAIINKEKIGIFGDFDADGVTSTALLLLFLKELGVETAFYIPHRDEEGYGLNIQGLDFLKRLGCSLVITVDCGITDVEEVNYARDRGLRIIVTDHHRPQNGLPLANAIINPRLSDCMFPFKDLAGVGVAFTLIIAIRAELRKRGFFKNGVPNLKKYLDLVALGTVADMMPLYEDNRIFVKEGLTLLAKGSRPGLAALLEVSGISRERIQCRDLAFKLGPRINAAGRMAHAIEAVELLITEDKKRAEILAKRLDQFNQQRQKLADEVLAEAKKMIQQEGAKSAYVLLNKNWPRSILGLVASKIVESVKRPVILLGMDGQYLAGSGRGPEGFDLFGALEGCLDIIESFGGHQSAAGLKLVPERFVEFKDHFENVASEVMPSLVSTDSDQQLLLDGRVDVKELLEPGYVEKFERLHPFGPGYDGPIFCLSNFNLIESRIIGQDRNHLKLKVGTDGMEPSKAIEIVAWGLGQMHDMSWQGLEIAFIPSINVWNGKKSLQLILKDARPAQVGAR